VVLLLTGIGDDWDNCWDEEVVVLVQQNHKDHRHQQDPQDPRVNPNGPSLKPWMWMEHWLLIRHPLGGPQQHHQLHGVQILP
jgi:hypothetical protein